MVRRVPGGLLVAFEGVDGAGKTTQARLAGEYLQKLGFGVRLLREPSDGPIGRQLRALLSGAGTRPTPEEEFRLFLDDRADDVQRNIQPALDQGEVVLIDRYYISSMAYQGARGLDPDWIREQNEKVAPVPHLTLLFVLPLEESLSRIDQRAGGTPNRNPFEHRQYQERVHAIFRSLDLPHLVTIDAAHTVDDVHQQIVGLLDKAVGERSA